MPSLPQAERLVQAGSASVLPIVTPQELPKLQHLQELLRGANASLQPPLVVDGDNVTRLVDVLSFDGG